MENKKSTKAKTEKENAQAAQAVDQQQFLAKLNDLLEMAKKKKNMLEYQEIGDYFKDMNLGAEQFEEILEFMDAHNMDVLRISDDDDEDILLDDEDEVEVEQIDLSVPDGVSPGTLAWNSPATVRCSSSAEKVLMICAGCAMPFSYCSYNSVATFRYSSSVKSSGLISCFICS